MIVVTPDVSSHHSGAKIAPSILSGLKDKRPDDELSWQTVFIFLHATADNILIWEIDTSRIFILDLLLGLFPYAI
jgi:hypothetical protein